MAQPLSIHLGDQTSIAYKSIQEIVWNDIPPFAVLTGLNGSGKTQFLEAIAAKLSGAYPQPSSPIASMPINATGLEPHEVAFLSSSENVFNIQGSSVATLQQTKQNFLQQLSPENTRHNLEMKIMRERLERKYGFKIQSQQDAPALVGQLPDDFLFMLQYSDVAASLSHVFMSYQIRMAQLLMDRKSEDQAVLEIGKAPWEFVNEALRSAEFVYEVVPPTNELLKPYTVQMKAKNNSRPLELNDLSSGEKTILRTILWFYNSKHNNIFPKLFLLDEPDAHLHPSMTRQFLSVLKDVLVDQYGVRVILTTHSPSTVAMAPPGSIFVMSRGQSAIQQAVSKAQAIGLLTAGLVFVSEGTRFILVEDEADVDFYGMVRDVLMDQGPSRDKKALKPAPSLVFLPASSGKGAKKIGGGSSVVMQWVDKFDSVPLSEMFFGFIDKDQGNIGSARVSVLSRYSIENYQLDPFVVFGVLIEEKIAPTIAGIEISPGDEHLLRELASDDLQKVIECIAQRIEPYLPSPDRALVDVTFTSGLTLSYPKWMISSRGHDLLPVYQKEFGQNILIPPRLNKSFRRIRLVPSELATIMSNLQ